MTLLPGATVDRYVLAEPLGQGGQAQVWRALDPWVSGRSFALKLLPLGSASPTEIERARREGHHLARLSHPTLPACHALFEDPRLGVLGLVLDLVEGTPLEHAASDPRMTPAHHRPLLRRIAEGLAYLHAQGLVHRDLKPANVLLAPTFWDSPEDPYSIRIIDLGISVPRGNPQPLTVLGGLIGTPPFLPPEQIDPVFWRHEGDTPAADVFALGVVAWWLLTGHHPTGHAFQEPLETFARTYRSLAQEQCPWPPAAPAGWEEFFRHSLALGQAERSPNAGLLVALLGGVAPVLPAARPTGEATPLQAAPAQPPSAPALAQAPPTGPSAGLPLAPPSAPPRPLPIPVTLEDHPLALPVAPAGPVVKPEAALPSHGIPQPGTRRMALLILGALVGAVVTVLLLLAARPWLRRRPRRARP
ncbi:MAG: serine/threonine protein kinase [Polyangiaceae bacterium]|nr:serine/threonine protein kinase [Polyangiaceae bacterium]